MHLEVGHKSVGYACSSLLPPFRKPQTRMEVSLLDYEQLAWLALPQFPYLSTGEVKIFQTHPICGSSL